VVAGDSVTYHLVVSNHGPDAATSVTVVDTLPSGVTFGSAVGVGWVCTHDGNVSVSCTRPTVADGATAPLITVVVTAPASVGDLTNLAAVSSTTPDPVADNNSSSVPTVVTSSTPGGDGDNGNGGELPHTGADGPGAALLGLALVVLGGALVTIGRRRRSVA